MSKCIIQASGLSKLYALGRADIGNASFRQALGRSFRAPLQRLRELRGDPIEDLQFWALRDVSFGVAEGEIVGLIGRNGAGKSTLLKILSRITAPTRGRVELRGRVGALLEVGTGFHPELSGRENIFLNGAILGMKRSEIIRRFDQIVAFAQIGKFLDTPAKRYSSGMYVRLAFAVAAHLEPEILIVDEVLAVGDAEFQRKCLGRMDELRTRAGRTLLLVSHNLEMVESLCTRCILLDGGRIVFDGNTADALDRYRSLGGRAGEITVTASNRLHWRGLRNRDGLRGLSADHDLAFELCFQSGESALDGVHFDVELIDDLGRKATHSKSRFVGRGFDLPPASPVVIRYTLRAPMLAPGHYRMLVHAYDVMGALCRVDQIDACDISSRSYFPSVDFIDEIQGATVPKFQVELLES